MSDQAISVAFAAHTPAEKWHLLRTPSFGRAPPSTTERWHRTERRATWRMPSCRAPHERWQFGLRVPRALTDVWRRTQL